MTANRTPGPIVQSQDKKSIDDDLDLEYFEDERIRKPRGKKLKKFPHNKQ